MGGRKKFTYRGPTMFDRIAKIFKGFFSLFISGIEKANPRALLEAESASLHEAVGTFNRNLARQAGQVEKLREQVKRQQKEHDLTKARAAASYNAKNFEEAGRLALQLKQLASDIADNEAGLKQAEDLYQTLTRQRDTYVREAQRRIESIKQKMSRAEMAEAQAQLAEIASSTAFDMAGSGATLQRIEEGLDERVATASGKARVATDMAKTGDWAMKEENMRALEQQALAEFATSMGLETPPTVAAAAPETVAAPPVRDLGPAETA